MVLGFSPLISILVTPIVSCLIVSVGAESVILAGGLLFVIANMGLSAVVAFSKFYFLLMTLGCQTVNGIAGACLCVGEQVILLRYSPKSERESNMG